MAVTQNNRIRYFGTPSMNAHKLSTIFTTSIVGLGLLLSPSLIFAATDSGMRREVRIEARCAVVNARIDARINVFDTLKRAHLQAYENAKDRAQKFIDRFNSQGLDTTTLKTDLQTFNDKVVKAGNDYQAFIDKLKEAKQYNCGDSQGQFRTTLEAARALLKTFRTDITDARTYFKNTILLDIRTLRGQLKNTNNTTQ